MSNLAKLSKQALELEQNRQYEKALMAFTRLFDEAASAEEEVDTALFNRAGDVAIRVGDAATAVRYFERAIDAYALGGLLNNAIAVCNKVLRLAPEHAATHHTLGVLHAKQGFRGDAKHHFVEYAERMHRAGRDDEALRALGEFAALCPPGDDARVLLAQHLAKGAPSPDIAARLDALLADAPDSRSARAAPEAGSRATLAASPVPSPGASSHADEDRPRDLVFLDIGLESTYDPATTDTSTVQGLEPTIDATPFEFESTLSFSSGSVAHETANQSSPADLTFDDSLLDDSLLDDSLLDVAMPFGESLDEPTDATLLDDSLFEFGAASGEPEQPLELSIEPPLDSQADGLLVFEPDPLDDPPLDLPMLDLLEEAASVSVAGSGGRDADDVSARSAAPPSIRWADALPNELPILSLTGWIGSLSAVAPDRRDRTPHPTSTPAVAAPVLVPGPEPVPSVAAAEYVDLGAWLRESEPEPSTRMTSADSTPTGDEAADFDRLLGAFRAGVARNVEEGDFESHYDLGIAFREMGLLDDAIAELQKAARAPHGGLRAREALAQCFLDRGSPDLVVETLQHDFDGRPGGDKGAREGTAHLGVLYLLGVAYGQLGQTERARACLQRVVAADIQFRDAAARLSLLSSASSPSP